MHVPRVRLPRRAVLAPIASVHRMRRAGGLQTRAVIGSCGRRRGRELPEPHATLARGAHLAVPHLPGSEQASGSRHVTYCAIPAGGRRVSRSGSLAVSFAGDCAPKHPAACNCGGATGRRSGQGGVPIFRNARYTTGGISETGSTLVVVEFLPPPHSWPGRPLLQHIFR